MLDRLERFPLPTVCAMNGSVYGGATDLALCCDLRIGVRGSRMLMPASRFGLHYYPGGLRRYVGTLGLAAAKKLDPRIGERARAQGLVDADFDVAPKP